MRSAGKFAYKPQKKLRTKDECSVKLTFIIPQVISIMVLDSENSTPILLSYIFNEPLFDISSHLRSFFITSAIKAVSFNFKWILYLVEANGVLSEMDCNASYFWMLSSVSLMRYFATFNFIVNFEMSSESPRFFL